MERGPVNQVLMDNATVFRSETLMEFFHRWNITPLFRAAYRASGNGIVERHHRTIKSMAERAAITPELAVFWYNSTPRSGQLPGSIPSRCTYQYAWRNPRVRPDGPDLEESRVTVGDEVWVKPPHARCTTQWDKGLVTEINSRNNVSVDGMPRHILDLRSVVSDEEPVEESLGSPEASVGDPDEGEDQEANSSLQQADVGVRRYPSRLRRPPAWLDQYEE